MGEETSQEICNWKFILIKPPKSGFFKRFYHRILSAPEESYTHRIMQVYVNICKVWVICSLIIPMFAGFYVLRNHATLLTKQYVKNLRR